ncbi:MAG TPA: hypothetical protein VF101_06235 [Gaiellaceae bacterium]
MNVSLPADPKDLMQEIVRYLAAVDLFRELGHEPTWRREVRAP